jgi:hypothetical protein
MSNTSTTTNTSIPITKMVNDLFLQWLSLPDTRTTLCTALQSVRTNSKMPDPIIYPKVCIYIIQIDLILFRLSRLIQHVAVDFLNHNISILLLFLLYHELLQVHVVVYHRFHQLVIIRRI